MTTFSGGIATVQAPLLMFSRGGYPYLGVSPRRLNKAKQERKGTAYLGSLYTMYQPFLEDRSDNLSPTRFSATDELVSRGLKPLEKTPSGASSGPSGKGDMDGKYSAIDFVPPSAVAKEAKKGLELRKRNEERKALPKGDPDRLGADASLGGTDIGVARAVQLMSGKPMPPREVRRMVAFFSRHRHEGTEGFGNDKRPSAGYVAHLIWGGDSGKKWAEKVVAQMEKVDAAEK